MKHGLQYDPEDLTVLYSQSQGYQMEVVLSKQKWTGLEQRSWLQIFFFFFFNVQGILFGDFLEDHETNICLL